MKREVSAVAVIPARLAPGDLGRLLGELPVHVEAVRCQSGALVLPDYPDEPRPTSILTLSGRGHAGHGENVAFSAREQIAFAQRVSGLGPRAAGTVAEVTAAFAAALAPTDSDLYGRAAIESALIDLALRQAEITLSDLCGAPAELPLRQVVSFAARADAAAHARAQLVIDAGVGFKIDVDPTWSPGQLAQLAQLQAIAVFDFKGQGDAALAARLAQACPAAWFEDPPAATDHRLIARDRSLLTPADVLQAARRGEAVNLKAPRMGGPRAVLAGLEMAHQCGALAYLGGMFEVGPGRQQARQLAALFCPDAPNDLAPIAGALGSAPLASRSAVRCDVAGFGATCAWGRAIDRAAPDLA